MEGKLTVRELSPEAKHELTMARMSIRVHPKLAIYFIPSLQLKVMACDQISTLCVDRNAHMLVNEEFWLGLDEKTRVSAVLHEVFHCAHEHPRRMDWMPPEYSFWANIAMDVVVNDTLAFYDMPIGEDWITAKYLKEKEEITLPKPGYEMSVEQVLKEMAPLRNKIQPPPEKGEGGMGGPSNIGEMTSGDFSEYFKSQNPNNNQNVNIHGTFSSTLDIDPKSGVFTDQDGNIHNAIYTVRPHGGFREDGQVISTEHHMPPMPLHELFKEQKRRDDVVINSADVTFGEDIPVETASAA